MRDSEKQYPRQRVSQRRSTDMPYRDQWEAEIDVILPTLPENRLPTTTIGGVIGGLLAVLLTVVVTLMNAPLYQEAARLSDSMSYTTASTIFGLTCLTDFLALLICFFTGFLVAKRVVQRLQGFFAGILVGAITYIGNSVVLYIPGYPGHIAHAASTAPAINGLLAMLVFLLAYALIGGLIALWGASTATRKHPYYLAKAEQEEATTTAEA